VGARWVGRLVGRGVGRCTGRWTGRCAGRWTGRWTGRCAGRWTGRGRVVGRSLAGRRLWPVVSFQLAFQKKIQKIPSREKIMQFLRCKRNGSSPLRNGHEPTRWETQLDHLTGRCELKQRNAHTIQLYINKHHSPDRELCICQINRSCFAENFAVRQSFVCNGASVRQRTPTAALAKITGKGPQEEDRFLAVC
jgi:hypothetical protein